MWKRKARAQAGDALDPVAHAQARVTSPGAHALLAGAESIRLRREERESWERHAESLARVARRRRERAERAGRQDPACQLPPDRQLTVYLARDGKIVLLPRLPKNMPVILTPDEAEALALRILATAARGPYQDVAGRMIVYTSKEITPQRARELLRDMHPSRHPDQQEVEDLAGRIRRDRSALRGHVVGVGTDGRLVAGQHVLRAIALADLPVRVTVRQEGPDQGKSVST